MLSLASDGIPDTYFTLQTKISYASTVIAHIHLNVCLNILHKEPNKYALYYTFKFSNVATCAIQFFSCICAEDVILQSFFLHYVGSNNLKITSETFLNIETIFHPPPKSECYEVGFPSGFSMRGLCDPLKGAIDAVTISIIFNCTVCESQPNMVTTWLPPLAPICIQIWHAIALSRNG